MVSALHLDLRPNPRSLGSWGLTSLRVASMPHVPITSTGTFGPCRCFSHSSSTRSGRLEPFIGEQRALSSPARGRAHLPALAPPPVPPGLGGTAGTAPIPGSRASAAPASLPPAPVAAGAGGGCTQSRCHRLVPPSAPQDAQGCLKPGEGPAGAAAAPWVPPSPNPSPRGLPARRTIGRRSTEPPKPMDQKLQLRHAEKNIPRAARAVFCLLQIPEPDPFSLWV